MRARLVWGLLLASCLCACGDDSGPTTRPDAGRGDAGATDTGPAAGDSGADAAADAARDGGGPTTGTLSVLVQGPGPTGSFADPLPAAGAHVVLDPPAGGMRVEMAAGADGRVRFEGIDWAAGTVAVTAYLEGHTVASRVGITREDGEVTLQIAPVEPDTSALVRVSGTLSNPVAADHPLMGWALGTSAFYLAASVSSYRFEVPPGEPLTLVFLEGHDFSLVAPDYTIEHFGWAVHEAPAVTADTTIDVDLTADRVMGERVQGIVRLPARAGSPLNGPETYVLPGAIHLGTATGYSLGWYTHGEHNPDGTYGYEVDFARVRPESEVFASYGVFSSASDATSFAVTPGYPTAGMQTFELLDVPTIEEPAAGTTGMLHGRIRWTVNGELGPSLLFLGRNGVNLWTVLIPDGATEVRVPELPPSVDPDAAIGPNPMRASLFTCDAAPPEWMFGCARRSTSESVSLTP